MPTVEKIPAPNQDGGGFHLRRAERRDARSIRGLIYRAGINPMGLDWRRFWIVEDGLRLIACGQIKIHGDGSRELASIAVVPERRQQGLARLVIERLLADAQRPLYLTCRPNLQGLYAKFGFQTLNELGEMPAYFRRVMKIARFIQRLSPRLGGLLVMRLTV